MSDPAVSEVLLEAVEVSKYYGAMLALDRVSVTVHAGEIVGLLGENGAGKSTLVKVLSGVLSPNSGRIVALGEEVHFRSPAEARKHGIETVHQQLALADALSVSDNMFLTREIAHRAPGLSWLGWLDKREMDRQTKEILATLGINIGEPRKRVRALSGGQRQAIVVGRAAAWGKRVVILDEPTAALGVEQSRQVLDLVRRLRQRGLGIVLISHNMQEVLDVCDRAIVLRHGRRVADINAQGVAAQSLVGLITGALTQEEMGGIAAT